ncbi:MAG: sialidase family protein [Opitutaceae bacterium]|nr:sialidase family protein [Opitutaceae bacterium]
MMPRVSSGETSSPSAHRLSPLSRVVLIGCALLTVLVAARFAPEGDGSAPADIAHFPTPAGVPDPTDLVPVFSQSWITPPGHTASAHSSAICALPSGDLLAVWYGGSREGGADVALFTARLTGAAGKWTPPVTAIDRAMAQTELDRAIKKVGNAVIFPDRTGCLWMVYVSVSLGGWSGSALNVKTSRDEGHTWGASQRLTLNPFFNLSSLVRNKPIYASDGRIGLPVYHEMALKFPQMLWLTPGPDGTVQDYRIRNLSSESGLIQPALVPLDHDRVLMMLRDRGGDRSLHTAYSDDNGWTWSEAAPSGLPNPDAAIDALRLRDGRILLVYNHAERGRENLRLAISADQGRTWRAGAVLEEAAHHEFSYPNLAEDRRGRIHLTYTWQRERIKHVVFNRAWLDRRLLVHNPLRP